MTNHQPAADLLASLLLHLLLVAFAVWGPHVRRPTRG